jgi:hypothetical protein
MPLKANAVALTLGLVLAAPVAARAQVRLEGSLFIGGYSALTSAEVTLPTEPFSRRATQSSTVALGAEVSGWWSRSLGVGLQVLTMASDPQFEHLLGLPDRLDGRVTVYSAHVLARLPSGASTFRPYVLAGPALVQRSGDAFEGLSGLWSPGAAVGIGMYYGLRPRLSLRSDASLLLYRLKMTGEAGAGSPASTQADLTFRIGLSAGL